MTGKVKVGVAMATLMLALLALGTTLWLNRAFREELASYRTSLADRTEAQRHNIRQAAKALDGVVLEPGEVFSFNQVVGPRAPERGYREAPAFMERDLVKSIGGGICQVSSTVYNAATLAGFTIVERHPHSRRVASVPPGRDATVWYGVTDLKLMNGEPQPVRLAVKVSNEALRVSVLAHRSTGKAIALKTMAVNSTDMRMAFETIRTTTIAGNLRLQESLSFDVYVK